LKTTYKLKEVWIHVTNSL